MLFAIAQAGHDRVVEDAPHLFSGGVLMRRANGVPGNTTVLCCA